jgi:hypothetical protein
MRTSRATGMRVVRITGLPRITSGITRHALQFVHLFLLMATCRCYGEQDLALRSIAAHRSIRPGRPGARPSSHGDTALLSERESRVSWSIRGWEYPPRNVMHVCRRTTCCACGPHLPQTHGTETGCIPVFVPKWCLLAITKLQHTDGRPLKHKRQNQHRRGCRRSRGVEREVCCGYQCRLRCGTWYGGGYTHGQHVPGFHIICMEPHTCEHGMCYYPLFRRHLRQHRFEIEITGQGCGDVHEPRQVLALANTRHCTRIRAAPRVAPPLCRCSLANVPSVCPPSFAVATQAQPRPTQAAAVAP